MQTELQCDQDITLFWKDNSMQDKYPLSVYFKKKSQTKVRQKIVKKIRKKEKKKKKAV